MPILRLGIAPAARLPRLPAVLRGWRRSHGLPEHPMQAFRESGYLERITAERLERNAVYVTYA